MVSKSLVVNWILTELYQSIQIHIFCERAGLNLWNIFAFCVVRWRRQWHPTPVLLPGKSHGRPGRLQSTGSRTVRHDWATSLSRIGEGNGNPLQCSCLENPRDGGAWWAAIYGVTQSRTRLKWLSSSSSSHLIWYSYNHKASGYSNMGHKCYLKI